MIRPQGPDDLAARALRARMADISHTRRVRWETALQFLKCAGGSFVLGFAAGAWWAWS